MRYVAIGLIWLSWAGAIVGTAYVFPDEDVVTITVIFGSIFAFVATRSISRS